MKIGDLVYLKPKIDNADDIDFVGLLLNFVTIGSGDRGSTTLYDVLINETNEVHTLSDIYFTIWRIE